jgi:hypothetical protein
MRRSGAGAFVFCAKERAGTCQEEAAAATLRVLPHLGAGRAGGSVGSLPPQAVRDRGPAGCIIEGPRAVSIAPVKLRGRDDPPLCRMPGHRFALGGKAGWPGRKAAARGEARGTGARATPRATPKFTWIG